MEKNKGKILVVDDEDGVRSLFREMLEEWGYLCYEAPDANVALDLLASRKIDLSLVDVMMPVTTGLTLFKHIKERYPHVAVIFVTAVDDLSIAVNQLKGGACDYLVKPVTSQRLRQAVEEGLKWRTTAVERDYMAGFEGSQSDQRLRLLLDSSPVGIFVIQDRVFKLVNPQFQQHTGYTEDELLGKDSMFLVHPDDREMVRNNNVEILKGIRHVSFEYRTIRNDGSTRWVVGTVASIQYFGSRAVLGYYQDVSERREVEEAEKRRAKELEDVNEELEKRQQELTALNQLFQKHIDERFTAVQSYREVVSGLERIAVEMNSLVEQAKVVQPTESMTATISGDEGLSGRG